MQAGSTEGCACWEAMEDKAMTTENNNNNKVKPWELRCPIKYRTFK